MNLNQRRSQVCAPITPALIILALGLGAIVAIAQPRKLLPTVSSASVPFYPRTPRLAHIEGVVRLRISTDGMRVSSLEIESGQPMLAQAAAENVKTWQFEQHTPTTFEATFRYRLLPSRCDSECNCDDGDGGTVQLRLPADVEVSAKEVLICDPAGNKRH